MSGILHHRQSPRSSFPNPPPSSAPSSSSSRRIRRFSAPFPQSSSYNNLKGIGQFSRGRNFEIYYGGFVQWNRPVDATLFHFKTNSNSNTNSCEAGDYSVDPLRHEGVNDSYGPNDDEGYDNIFTRSYSMPNVHSRPETFSPPPNHNVPIDPSRSTGQVSRKNSFVSNCIHDTTASSAPAAVSPSSPSSSQSMGYYYSSTPTSTLHENSSRHPSISSRHPSISSRHPSISSVETPIEEEENDESEKCKRHHHRRGSVAIKFHNAQIVNVEDEEEEELLLLGEGKDDKS